MKCWAKECVPALGNSNLIFRCGCDTVKNVSDQLWTHSTNPSENVGTFHNSTKEIISENEEYLHGGKSTVDHSLPKAVSIRRANKISY